MNIPVADVADTRSLHLWSAEEPGRIAPGSEAHKRLFCRMLLETHNPYKPALMNWPSLDNIALSRITSLPIWDMAVQTEGRASIRVATYASSVRDPLLREALDLDGAEEARHKLVLSGLVQSYGIDLQPEPAYPPPQDAEWAWLVTGFSECIDSFFAFGLFELAKRSGFFPIELVETFEPVIQEEARHILFFANWVAWYRKNLPFWRRPLFFFEVLAVWGFLIRERIGLARSVDGAGKGEARAAPGEVQDANFTVAGSAAIGTDLTLREMLALCLAENDRRMAGYDSRLLRPATVPFLARAALRVLGWFGRRPANG